MMCLMSTVQLEVNCRRPTSRSSRAAPTQSDRFNPTLFNPTVSHVDGMASQPSADDNTEVFQNSVGEAGLNLRMYSLTWYFRAVLSLLM
jgi:hypothetical protein